MRQTQEILPEAVQRQSSQLLNQHLSAMIVLHSQFEMLHRRLRGPNFVIFQHASTSISIKLSLYCSLFVKRIGALRQNVYASIEPSIELYLSEAALNKGDDVAVQVVGVAKAFAASSRGLRDAARQATHFGDRMTAEVFKEVLCGIDRQLWLVETCLLPGLTGGAATANSPFGSDQPSAPP
jgi:DNA-binding ferritin-like protein